MKQETVSVSVVVPAYESSPTIGRTLTSVMEQTSIPREVIVVDDGSIASDELATAVEKASSGCHVRVRLHRLDANRGPAAARNIGWDLASAESEYVAFLDADDRWDPLKLRNQTEWMQGHRDIAWTAHRCRAGKGSMTRHTPSRNQMLSRNRLLTSNPVATPTVMIARHVQSRFREHLRSCEDVMLWLDLLDAGLRGVLLGQTLATLGRQPTAPGGLTGDLHAMHEGMLSVLQILVDEGRLPSLDHLLFRGLEDARYARRVARRLLG